MKQLVIHADDLGADEARNAGIFEAIEGGGVTGTSLLANGPAFEDAVRQIPLLSRKVSIGVHINLSEGIPLSKGLRLLVGTDGSLLGKSATHKRLMDSKNTELEEEIGREVSAQIRRVIVAGIKPDHLDGHQHVHVFPAPFPIVYQIARDSKIPWMRIPEENILVSTPDEEDPLPEQEVRFFSTIARKARGRISGYEIRIPDHFHGLALKGGLSLNALCDLFRKLQPGLSELMVHPGRVPALPRGPFGGFSTSDREKELQALLDPDLHRCLEEAQIQITPFPGDQD